MMALFKYTSVKLLRNPMNLLYCLLVLVILHWAGSIGFSLESEEEFRKKLEELRDDPTLSREERLRRHRKKLALILERRKKEKELEMQRKRAEAEKKAQEAKSVEPPKKTSSPMPSIPKPRGNIGAFLSIEPLDVQVKKGEEFFTKVVYSDFKEYPIKALRFVIKYDKQFLVPLTVYDYPLHTVMAGSPEFDVDKNKGIITYGCKLKIPQSIKSKTPLLIIKWKALQETTNTEIRFLTGRNYTSIIADGITDYLGTSDNAQDGVISCGVTISDDSVITTVSNFRSLLSAPELSNKGIASAMNTEQVGLQLSSSKSHIIEGEEFIVDVLLINPHHTIFDDLSLCIRFDPEQLEVVDWDKGNWIRRGINIYDGFAHEEYPFDFLKLNTVDNKKGVIKYAMGLSQLIDLPTGVFAKIKFRAKKTVSPKTLIYFDYADEDFSGFTTDVKSFGMSVLDKKNLANCQIAFLSGVGLNNR